MFAHSSLARFSRFARGPLCAAASPLRYLQGSAVQNNLRSFAMDRRKELQIMLQNTGKQIHQCRDGGQSRQKHLPKKITLMKYPILKGSKW